MKSLSNFHETRYKTLLIINELIVCRIFMKLGINVTYYQRMNSLSNFHETRYERYLLLANGLSNFHETRYKRYLLSANKYFVEFS